MSVDLTCREFVELVTDYLERALHPGERLRCEHHLVVCSGCAGFLDDQRATMRLTASLGTHDELGDRGRRQLLDALERWRSDAS